MVWVWVGWNSQSRSKCVLCDRVLKFYNSQPTCGTCYSMWKEAGGDLVNTKVAEEERQKSEALSTSTSKIVDSEADDGSNAGTDEQMKVSG